MKRGCCKDCRYLYRFGDACDRPVYRCYRYPEHIDTFLMNWCGEFKKKR